MIRDQFLEALRQRMTVSSLVVRVISIGGCESYLVSGRAGNEAGSNPRSGYQALTGMLHFCNFRAGWNV